MPRRRDPDPIAAPLRQLCDESPEERVEALQVLFHLAVDQVDVRDVQSLVAWLIDHDPALDVRVEAMRLTELRASEGCDVGFAIPICLRLAADLDQPPALRALASRVLEWSEPRTPTR